MASGGVVEWELFLVAASPLPRVGPDSDPFAVVPAQLSLSSVSLPVQPVAASKLTGPRRRPGPGTRLPPEKIPWAVARKDNGKK